MYYHTLLLLSVKTQWNTEIILYSCVHLKDFILQIMNKITYIVEHIIK